MSLGFYEMPPPSVRSSVSSSEIMYELAVARFDDGTDETEAEDNSRRRYCLDRKLSFDSKSETRNDVLLLDDSSSSLNRLQQIVDDDLQKLKGDGSLSNGFVERFEVLERSIVNYNRKSEERNFDKPSDDTGDETCRSPLAKRVFIPIAVQLPVREFPEMVPTPSSLGPPSLVTIDEEASKDDDASSTKTEVTTTEIKRVVVRETESPERPVEPLLVQSSKILDQKSIPSSTNSLPKPILKVRDDTNESKSSIKRVRIEEPDIDIGLQAGEVARNRRKQKWTQNDDYTEPSLRNDETVAGSDNLYEIETSDVEDSSNDDPEVTLPSERRSFGRSPTKKFPVQQLSDLFLFLMAVCLFYFKNPHLALPVLLLAVYRRTKDPLFARITAFRTGLSHSLHDSPSRKTSST